MTRSPFIFGAALTAALLATGCPPSRYASCQTEADCAGRAADGGKLICYNLRCVECHYDTDCGEGKHCGANNVCESLDTRTPEAPSAKMLEECIKRCSGSAACADGCREKLEIAPK